MKLCFPVETDNGIDSQVYGHFGSAPVFVVFDTDTSEVNSVKNQNLGHSHGMCSPIRALDGQKVDAIVVGGIGAGAINKLNSMGIKVYRAIFSTVKLNAQKFDDKLLPELTIRHACSGHSGGCSH